MLEQEDPWADRPPAVPHEYRGKPGFLKWVPARIGRNSEYKRGSKRTAFPSRNKPTKLLSRAVAEIVPWRVWEYPGQTRMLAGICGSTVLSARVWLSGSVEPGARVLRRLASFLRAKAATFIDLAAELEREASTRAKPGRRSTAALDQVRAGSGLLPPAE